MDDLLFIEKAKVDEFLGFEIAKISGRVSHYGRTARLSILGIGKRAGFPHFGRAPDRHFHDFRDEKTSIDLIKIVQSRENIGRATCLPATIEIDFIPVAHQTPTECFPKSEHENPSLHECYPFPKRRSTD